MVVRVYSVRIIGKMAEYVESSDEHDLVTLQALVPGVVDVCAATMAADDDESIRHVFDVIDTLNFSVRRGLLHAVHSRSGLSLIQDTPILGNFVPQLVQFLLQAAANQSYSSEARMAPLNALLFLVK